MSNSNHKFKNSYHLKVVKSSPNNLDKVEKDFGRLADAIGSKFTKLVDDMCESYVKSKYFSII